MGLVWRRVRRIVRWSVATVCLAGTAGVIVVMSWFPLRDYLYRELSYRVLLNRIVGEERDPHALTRLVMEYVHATLYPDGGPVVDADPWFCLVRGIGWCDQQAWTMGTLLSIRGIESRLVMLSDEQGVKRHTVLEVFLDGAWRLVDPQYGLIVEKSDGSLATLRECSEDPTLLTHHPRVQRLTPTAQQHIIEHYAAIFPLRQPADIWSSITEARRASAPQALLATLIDRAWRHVGPAGARRVQDLYLALLPQRPALAATLLGDDIRMGRLLAAQAPEALQRYEHARNHHLYGRFREALEDYQNLAVLYPGSSYDEKSRLWAGVALLRMGELNASVSTHLVFLTTWPESPWRNRGYDYLVYEAGLGGEADAVSEFALRALNDPYVSLSSQARRVNGAY